MGTVGRSRSRRIRRIQKENAQPMLRQLPQSRGDGVEFDGVQGQQPVEHGVCVVPTAFSRSLRQFRRFSQDLGSLSLSFALRPSHGLSGQVILSWSDFVLGHSIPIMYFFNAI